MTKHRLAATCHKDGTVTYWGVYSRRWERRSCGVPDDELAAMGRTERERIIRHLARAEGRNR